MNLKELTQELPYKWRVQSFSAYKAQATCVAYIDSRDVQDLLDKVCGPENWQDEYYQVKNTMCCKIGIAIPVMNPEHDKQIGYSWVWKSDGGTETDVESEKGELSDAFKRAAVKWGIGRFLYTMGMKYIPASEIKTKENKPYVVDNNGQRVWDITAHINGGNAAQGHPAPVFRAKEVTPPMEPTAQELTETFEDAVIPHDEPATQHRERCPKCPGMMDYKEGISSKTGKPYKMWRCASCGEAQFIKTK